MSRGRRSSDGRGDSSSYTNSSYTRFRSRSTLSSLSANDVYGISSGESSAIPNSLVNTVATIIGGMVFFVVGMVIVFIGIKMCVMPKVDEKWNSTFGTVVDNTYTNGWYYATYSYEVNDVEYTSQSIEGWEHPAHKGSSEIIWYLESNPYKIAEAKPKDVTNNRTGGVVAIIMGSIFTLVGGGISVSAFKKKKSLASTVEEMTGITLTQPETTPKTTCTYCGTMYENNQTSCPNCGANNKK